MERKEPTFSGIGSDNSEPQVAVRPQAQAQSHTQAQTQPQPKKAQKVRPAPVSSAQAAPAKGSSVASFALIVALLGLGLAGYLFWVLQQTQQQLSDANGQILELQQALVLTGDESTQSMAGLQANIRKQQSDLVALKKELGSSEHEIRKLWDTRNVNKKAIEANKKSLDQQASKTKSLPADVKSLKSKLDTQAKQLSSVRTDAGQALESTMLLSGSLEQQQQAVRELVDAGTQAENTLLNLKQKVEDNGEAIRSIDAFRKNTNSELWKLKQQLQPRTSAAQ